MTQATIEQGLRVRAPADGGPDTAVTAETAWDLSGYVGRYVSIKADGEGDYVLWGMRATSSGTLDNADNTAIVAGEGISKLSPGDEAVFQVAPAYPFLVFKRANSTDTKVYINVAD